MFRSYSILISFFARNIRAKQALVVLLLAMMGAGCASQQTTGGGSQEETYGSRQTKQTESPVKTAEEVDTKEEKNTQGTPVVEQQKPANKTPAKPKIVTTTKKVIQEKPKKDVAAKKTPKKSPPPKAVVKPVKPKPVTSKPVVVKKEVPKKETAPVKAAPKVISSTEALNDPTKDEAEVAESGESIGASLLTDLNQLPLNIDGNWSVTRDATNDLGCTLSYKQVEMTDGHGPSKVNVFFTKDKAVFKTRSNIDLSYADTGVKVDDGLVFPIEGLYNETSIVYQSQYAALTEAMRSGQTATLSLGFWPTWPVTQAYSVDLDISQFKSAFDTLSVCVALENELR